MDYQKIYRNAGIIGLVLVLSLAWVPPVLADPPINDEFHINSTSISSGELPANLPVLPATGSMPAIRMPYVNHANWPTTTDERAALKTIVSNRVSVLRSSLNARYTDARLAVRAVRQTTDMVSNAIGDPMSVQTHSGERALTVTAMAQEMAQSVEFSLGYARAVAGLGPVGLDLVFVFAGLGWIVFVNVVSLVVRVAGFFIRALSRALGTIGRLLSLLIDVLRLIVAILDLFWPF